ncbi:uncharacterized protein LOC134272204 [Saccostrea cucullata]|uniref:uncharacterized protein LOC134272204 n=1 Tax=Saccostrea cuccullata TaxID=36930 RepID=UPI002ED54078
MDSRKNCRDEQYGEEEFEEEEDEGEEEEEGSEDEFLQNFDEEYNFEDNRKVIEGLSAEYKDIKKKLAAIKKEVDLFDQDINKTNQKILEKEEKIKDLQEKENKAKSDKSYYHEKYEEEKGFGDMDGMGKKYNTAKSMEENIQQDIIVCEEEISLLNQELETMKKNKYPRETLLERIKTEKERKENQIKTKRQEKRRAKTHEYSLMPSPFQPFSGDSECLDVKVKKHYFQKIQCIGALPEECTRINILLVGPTGAGKSSFLNTSATALEDKGRMIHVSTTRRIESESATMKLIPEELKINKDKNLTAMIFDCRGLTMTGKQPIGKKEMELIIGGHIRPFSEISDAMSMMKNEHIYLKDPNIEDEMHCIVYAIKAIRDGELLNENLNRELKSLLDILTSTSKPQFILLTNMDKVVPNNDIANLFRYPCVKRKCNEASDVTHVTPAYILPTANYTTELEPTDVKDALCLLNLYRIVSNAHDYVTRRIIEINTKSRFS